MDRGGVTFQRYDFRQGRRVDQTLLVARPAHTCKLVGSGIEGTTNCALNANIGIW